MKDLVVNSCMNVIKKDNLYDDIKLEEIKYGLTAVYLNLSKFIVFFTINALFGIFKEGLLFLVFYIPLRSFSYGFHAKSSLTCWVLSAITFIILPLLSTLLTLNLYIKIIFIIYCLVIYYLYSPADTPSRPIINKKLRLKLKLSSIIIIIIYSIIIISFNNTYTNLMIIAMLYQSIMITPIFYKIFGVKYNNYLYYGLN